MTFPINTDNEHLKHHLVFDRPHIYKCTCGMVMMIFISEAEVKEKTLEHPKNIKYLPCGHAECALVNGHCVICGN